jgi:hypothetical protein
MIYEMLSRATEYPMVEHFWFDFIDPEIKIAAHHCPNFSIHHPNLTSSDLVPAAAGEP